MYAEFLDHPPGVCAIVDPGAGGCDCRGRHDRRRELECVWEGEGAAGGGDAEYGDLGLGEASEQGTVTQRIWRVFVET